MRNWFPFSDYDFFGYLVSGFALVFVVDYVFNSGAIILRDSWTFVQIILAMGIAYFAGQIIAWPASLILEHLLARRILPQPVAVMLSDGTPGLFVRVIGAAVIGRNYSPLPDPVRASLFQRAASENYTSVDKVKADVQLVFEPAFQAARQNSDLSSRIDSFRNQYGLNRNMAFASLVATGIFAWGPSVTAPTNTALLVVSFVLFCGLLTRFLKFYAAFAAEILKAYAYTHPGGGEFDAHDS